METDSDSQNEAQRGDQNPLPAAHPAPKTGEVPAVDPLIPAGKQNEAHADPKRKHGYCHVNNAKHPVFVKTVESREFSPFEKRTILFGFLGLAIGFLSLLAACIAGYLVYHQWWEMNAQTGFMNLAAKQARVESASSTVSTASQIAIMQGQLNQQQKAMAMEERAWLGLGDARFSITPDELLAQFTAKNVGKSPAISVTNNIAWIGKRRGDIFTQKDIVYSQKDTRDGTIFPSQTFRVNNSLPKPVPPFQTIFVQQLQHGERILYVFGKVEYRDIFGASHWTH
ncbi:MAG: hypothetical protein ACYDBH_08610 [Acidobacteriaceae bacterium]